MLVINRVELACADQPGEMGKFERHSPGRREEELETGDEIIQIGGMGQDVVRHDEIGGKIGTNTSRRLATEERDLGRNTSCDSVVSNVCGRLYAQDIQPAFPKELE